MKIQIRSKNEAEITGYVNVVGRESRVLHDVEGTFVEIVQPKTFERALEKAEEVGLMFNHQRTIGSTKTNLELKEDNIGLYARALITDAEVIQQAIDGKLSGWSFGFYVEKDSWDTRKDGMKLRTLEDIDLLEVSILNVTPAYIATSVEMRDGNAKMKEFRQAEGMVDMENLLNDNPPDKPATNSNLEHLKRKFEFDFLLK